MSVCVHQLRCSRTLQKKKNRQDSYFVKHQTGKRLQRGNKTTFKVKAGVEAGSESEARKMIHQVNVEQKYWKIEAQI